MDYGAECKGCRWVYENRRPPQEPPCDTCMVIPYPENRDALTMFLAVRYQFVSDSVGPIDISHTSIDLAMKREGIESKECFNKVLTLVRWWIDRLRRK